MTSKKILIIDCDKQTSEDFRDLFEQYGFIAFRAVNENEAIELLQKEKPDFVIFDPVLPGDFLSNFTNQNEVIRGESITKFGFVLFEKISKLLSSNQTVFFCSTEFYPDLKEAGFPVSGRFFQYFTKPVVVKEMIKLI